MKTGKGAALHAWKSEGSPGRGRFARALACMLVAALVPLGASAATAPWLKVETSDVVVYGNVSKADLVEFTVRYAAFRHAFSVLMAPEGRSPPPSIVVLFTDARGLKEHLNPRRMNAANLLWSTTTADDHAQTALAVSGDRDEALSTAFEFDTVWLLKRVGYALPVWMEQGAGEVMASMRLRDGVCIVGKPQVRFTAVLDARAPIPWPHFFEIGVSSQDYLGTGDMRGLFLSQSWALMNEVLLSGGTSRGPFERLAKLEQRPGGRISGEVHLRRVAEALGVEPSGLDARVRGGRRAEPLRVPFDEASVRAKVSVVPAPMEEVYVQFADMASGDNNTLDRDYELGLAVDLAPNSVTVKEAQARNDMKQGDRAAAVRHYREAIALGSTDSKAYQASAALRLDEHLYGGADREGVGWPELPQTLEEIRHALRISPWDGHAFVLLGRAYFVSPQVTEAQAEELSPEVGDAYAGPSVRFYRGLLYGRLGRMDLFQADMRAVMEGPGATKALREQAARFLANAVKKSPSGGN